ncbi:MAG: Mth938-like domain-containing protein [Reyranella sp.]|nr:Mth938-like domain-containing protein [Reyranella sp.]
MIPPRPASGGRAPDDKTLPAPDPAQVQLIRSYGPGRFLISDREWRQPVLVTPTATTAWTVARAEELTLESLAALKAAPVPTELLVLGCGARAIFVPPDLRAALKAAGLALEVVDTGSACRIYNVLLAESRRVAAALIPL